jgi:superfamily II DNA or RNA helicase
VKLRPYQAETVEAVEAGWFEASRQLVVIPTGGGKTIVFSHLAARRQPKPTLILAHREELIEQAAAKLHAATGIVAEIEKAERRASLRAPVVVASVQTLTPKRLKRWPADHFAQVIADEAHHAISPSWLRVLNHFDAHADVLGVTATPDRGDRRDLGTYFERVAHQVRLLDLIRDGYLSPIVIRSVPLKINLGGVKQTAGDFDAAQTGAALEPYLPQIAEAIRTHTKGRRTLVFLPLIETSKKFRDACRGAGLRAEHVDGYSEDRAEVLARFARWDFDVLCNAMLLTEGYDDPGIECVVVLRPTKSRPLYAQMVGRGTRVDDLKENLLLLDFLWMHERHNVTRPANLVAETEELANAVTKIAQEKGGGGEDGEEVDLLEVAGSASAQREAALARELADKASRREELISADDFATRHNAAGVATYQPTADWERQPVTPKQAKGLKRAGVDVATVENRGHAKKILDVVFANDALSICSTAQRQLLLRFGHPHADTASLSEFRAFMGSLYARRNT